MNLNTIIDSISNFEGITRKNLIKDVTSMLQDSYNINGRTILGFGDDASGINIGNDQLLLLAADGMWGKLMDADPEWAGYCSVLVNVNDIAAMGGIPMGMTNILSVKDHDMCKAIMNGVRKGVHKFGVPMVGGHVHPDAPYNALDVSIAGIVARDDIIISGGAQVGDKIIVGIDLDGETHPNFPLNWDTTTMKSPELVQDQIAVMNHIGHANLVTAGRDISNPGTLGTVGMLLESSGVGGRIELGEIPRNESINWVDWLKLYPGSGFALTALETNVDECIRMLNDVNITSNVVGEVIAEKKVYLKYKNQEKVLFDFNEHEIMGIKEEVNEYE